MTKSHKILVFIPPLLIGLTILMTLFMIQHQSNQVSKDKDSSREPDQGFVVGTPLPPVTIPATPEDPQVEPGDTEPDTMVACTLEAKMCPDGSFVGRTGPNCEFDECPSSVEPEFVTCEPGSRLAEACIEIFAPVCGLQEVQCVTEPCDPVPVTIPNSCFACIDATVIGYTEGACEA